MRFGYFSLWPLHVFLFRNRETIAAECRRIDLAAMDYLKSLNSDAPPSRRVGPQQLPARSPSRSMGQGHQKDAVIYLIRHHREVQFRIDGYGKLL